MFGQAPSEAAKYALNFFKKKNDNISKKNKINLLELGSGLGRDTKYFITESDLINIKALDYSS